MQSNLINEPRLIVIFRYLQDIIVAGKREIHLVNIPYPLPYMIPLIELYTQRLERSLNPTTGCTHNYTTRSEQSLIDSSLAAELARFQ